ncbi:hypothetical protein D3C86_1579660 [compost metagenome]
MGLHPNRQQIDRINIFSANFTGKFIYGIKSCDHVYFTLDNIPAAFSAAGCEHQKNRQGKRKQQSSVQTFERHNNYRLLKS